MKLTFLSRISWHTYFRYHGFCILINRFDVLTFPLGILYGLHTCVHCLFKIWFLNIFIHNYNYPNYKHKFILIHTKRTTSSLPSLEHACMRQYRCYSIKCVYSWLRITKITVSSFESICASLTISCSLSRQHSCWLF